MKTASFLKAMLISWLMAGIILPVAAQVDESIQNLYETAGKKQTNKDFKPAPDEIETSFGTLKFDMEAYPTEETVQNFMMNWICKEPHRPTSIFIRHFQSMPG